MTRLILLLALCLFATTASADPILFWDTVTTGDGGALGAGLEIKQYDVYRCPTNVNPCTVAAGTKVATVPATVPITPRQQVDLAGQAFPANFMVTATNVVAPSQPSASLKATPGDSPKNLELK